MPNQGVKTVDRTRGERDNEIPDCFYFTEEVATSPHLAELTAQPLRAYRPRSVPQVPWAPALLFEVTRQSGPGGRMVHPGWVMPR